MYLFIFYTNNKQKNIKKKTPDFDFTFLKSNINNVGK